jgi:hypothetical protein
VLERFEPARERRLLVELHGRSSAGQVLSALEGLGVEVRSFRLDDERGGRQLSLGLEFPREAAPERVVVRLSELEQVVGARWSE